MLKVNIPVAPMVLGFVLGPIAENNMRMALTMTRGDYSVFFTRPISVVFLALAVLSVLYSLYSIRKDNVRVTEQQNAKEL
jgi:putative tricarboxylic transport membrane protein